jgi:uncharacterized protein YjbI with pentapeptide repeats
MSKILNSLYFNSKTRFKIENQTFSDEILLEKKMMGSIFSDLTFNNITFEKINFRSASFIGCQFNKCIFNESNLTLVKISVCNFANCTFNESILIESDIEAVTFHCCNFKKGSFAKAYIDNSRIIDTEFEIDYYPLSPVIENLIIVSGVRSVSFFGDLGFYDLLEFLKKLLI